MTAEETVLEGAAARRSRADAARGGRRAGRAEPDRARVPAADEATEASARRRRRRRREDAAGEVEARGGATDEVAAGDEPQASASDADVSSDAGEDTPRGVPAGDPPA